MSGIRVLIVDDSLVFREMLSKELMPHLPSGSVIEKAMDPFEARDKILAFDPDVMLLDIEMPKMDGVEFLRRLLSQYDQPTIMLSGTPEYRQLALSAGAVDFVVKPSGNLRLAGGDFFISLAAKLCAAATARTSQHKEMKRLIALGASTGGTEALASVLNAMEPPLPPIVIVQHIPPMFSRLFAERLDHDTKFSVKEAENGDVATPNHVYVAPGDKHLRVMGRRGPIRISCKKGEKVNGHCPSVDVMFDSVAENVGLAALGVIFTGMGSDGAKGLLKVRASGAMTIGQDERTCVVYGMPRVAYEIGAVKQQLPLQMIPGAITAWAHGV